jgi:hypothetical protein
MLISPIANRDEGDGATARDWWSWPVDPAISFGKSCSQIVLLVALLQLFYYLLIWFFRLENLLIRSIRFQCIYSVGSYG